MYLSSFDTKVDDGGQILKTYEFCLNNEMMIFFVRFLGYIWSRAYFLWGYFYND